jgi:hypothetical protein
MSDRDLETGLAAIRRKRAQMWAVLIGYLPMMILVALSTRALGLDDETFVIPAALTWMALLALAIVRAGWARCPRCGKRFSQRMVRGLFVYVSNPFNRRCLNCNLALK